MTPKDIAVFLEDVDGCASRLQYAAALAAGWDAYLTAIFVADELELNRMAGFAIGAGLANMLASHDAEVQAAEARMRQTFDALVSARGLEAEWRIANHESRRHLVLLARHASLAVIGPPARPQVPSTRLSLLEDMIFSSGRPTLLIPNGWPPERAPRKVVLAWNGSAEAVRALACAMPLLSAAEEVAMVTVPNAGIVVDKDLDPGDVILRHLAHHGVEAGFHRLEGHDAGDAILAFCETDEADLLVMGAYGHSKFSEAIFGGATRHVLRHAELPILLSR